MYENYMFDIKWIRENPEKFDLGLENRGSTPCSADLIEIDGRRRKHLSQAQQLQEKRNRLSQFIGEAKTSGGDVSSEIRELSGSKKEQVEEEKRAKLANEELQDLLSKLPNLALEDVPVGESEQDNVEVSSWGEINDFKFRPKDHVDLGVELGMMDFETVAKISGARFTILTDRLAMLERALGSFMLDLHIKHHGYTEVSPPVLVKGHSLLGTGQLPKFKGDLFYTDDDYYLIPTAEVPLTNTTRETIVDEEKLPIRLTALTQCFRSEAGAAGRDTRGMIRQHQFSKVELVSITTEKDSESELERMTDCAEEVLKQLGLPFRRILLSTGDMGFSAMKTYDIEVWLPGQNNGEGQYREISSCSTCGDFQAMRMKSRYKSKNKKGTNFVHTLNGSGVAVGRALVAVLENYQESDGSVRVPDVLIPYMNGLKLISSSS